MTKLSWIDSHCHLDMLERGVSSAFTPISESELKLCLTIGTQSESIPKILQYVQDDHRVYGALGIHPHHAQELDQTVLSDLRTAIENEQKIVAIGECGYDFHYHHSTPEEQKTAFEQQLDLALELDLPVIIHTREAEEETIRSLDHYKSKNLRGVFHSFTSSPALAEYALKAGFYISFNGIATFPKSTLVRDILKITPLDRILLETDSPFLSPIPLRGQTNLPINVGLVGKFLADFLQISAEEFAEQTKSNTLTLFSRITHED